MTQTTTHSPQSPFNSYTRTFGQTYKSSSFGLNPIYEYSDVKGVNKKTQSRLELVIRSRGTRVLTNLACLCVSCEKIAKYDDGANVYCEPCLKKKYNGETSVYVYFIEYTGSCCLKKISSKDKEEAKRVIKNDLDVLFQLSTQRVRDYGDRIQYRE